MSRGEYTRKQGRRAMMLGIGMLSSVVGAAALFGETDETEEFYRAADKNINAAVDELEGSDYDVLDVSSEGLIIETELGEVIFELDADGIFEYGSDDVIDNLSQGQYLEEGADFFGVVADNLADTSQLDKITLRYEAGLENRIFEYRASVEALEALESQGDYEEFYRNEFGEEVHVL